LHLLPLHQWARYAARSDNGDAFRRYRKNKGAASPVGRVRALGDPAYVSLSSVNGAVEVEMLAQQAEDRHARIGRKIGRG
jgi:hypothetical protein